MSDRLFCDNCRQEFKRDMWPDYWIRVGAVPRPTPPSGVMPAIHISPPSPTGLFCSWDCLDEARRPEEDET